MRLAALLFAFAMVVQPLRAEKDLLVCRMSGAVLKACCCPAETATAGLDRPCCCDVVHTASVAPRAQQVSSAPDTSPVAIIVPPLPATALAPRFLLAEAQVDRPTATPGPPRIPRYLALLRLLG